MRTFYRVKIANFISLHHFQSPPAHIPYIRFSNLNILVTVFVAIWKFHLALPLHRVVASASSNSKCYLLLF